MNLIFQFTAQEAWRAQLADCERAKVSIDLEQYIFTDTAIGREFIECLTKKVMEGVRVRILLDMYGSANFYRDQELVDLVRGRGIKLLFFNPIKNWRLKHFWHWFSRRDHRKLLLVDNKIAHVGSAGVSGHMTSWLEANVRIEGVDVSTIASSFDNLWHAAMRGTLSRTIFDTNLSRNLKYISSTPHLRRRRIHRYLLRQIRRAKLGIQLVSPYYIPTERLQVALARAIKRGVAVSLIVPNQSDLWFIDLATHEYARLLAKRGGAVYFSNDFIHGKYVVIDDKWAMLGSANFDNLSLLDNYEHALIGSDPDLVSSLTRNFASLISKSIPIQKRTTRLTLKQRLFFIIAHLVHRFL